MTSATEEPTLIGTPLWWLQVLEDELTVRRAKYEEYRKLVDGDHPDPLRPNSGPYFPEPNSKYARLAGLSTTNLCGLAVEATAERMKIEGIRVGDATDNDQDAWDIWQASEFREWSQHAITAALINGRSMLTVVPRRAGKRWATLRYEDPAQVVVAYDEFHEPRAALKLWTDEWTGEEYCALYLNGLIFRYRDTMSDLAARPPEGTEYLPVRRRWEPREDVDEIVRNPYGRIPFWEMQNRPLGKVRSEIEPLIIPQRGLNQTMFNLHAISEYGAFRQKWATGIDIPRDPVTGDPLNPFDTEVSNMFLSEHETAKFGDFNATDMKPHIELIREIAGHMARISRLPVTYFLTDVNNVGSETLALLVSGLVSKCQRRVLGYEPGITGAVRMALELSGVDIAPDALIAVNWADMETRSMAQSADAAVKLTAGDNPVITNELAQEKYLGLSPEEQARDRIWRIEEDARRRMQAVVAGLTAPAAPQNAEREPGVPENPDTENRRIQTEQG